MTTTKNFSLHRGCIPVKLFEFPRKTSENTRPITTKVIYNKNNTFYSKKSSAQHLSPDFSKAKIHRSLSNKSIFDRSLNEKSLIMPTTDSSFTDHVIEERKLLKTSTHSIPQLSRSKQIKQKLEDSPSCPLFIHSFYNIPGVLSPSALIKKPLKLTQTRSSLHDPDKAWLSFDTFSVSKPCIPLTLQPKLSLKAPVQAKKPKKKVLALIPQPTQYCTTPFTINSESTD